MGKQGLDTHSAEPRTLHATTSAWLGQLALPLVFFILLTLTAIRAAGLNPLAGALGLGVILLVAGYDYGLPMLRNWLLVDRRSISGSLNGRQFEVYWTEILAAWLFVHNRRRFLCLGTRDGALMIPLRFFDHTVIWERVQASVPPEVLREEALRRLPDYQDWSRAREQVAASDSPLMVIDHWLVQIVGWVSMVFFVLGVIDALHSGQIQVAAIFIFLAGISLLILLSWGITELSAEKIQRHTLFGGWSMGWDQVKEIEIDPLDTVLVLVGEDRQMVIPGPGVWSGNRREALALLMQQIEQRGIPMRRNPLAAMKFSRKTRARK